jgi:hypothetical protein
MEPSECDYDGARIRAVGSDSADTLVFARGGTWMEHLSLPVSGKCRVKRLRALMMKRETHSPRYRVWNQLRLAAHVNSYFQVYDELTRHRDSEGGWGEFTSVLSINSRALFQAIVVHLDMLKSTRGVSLYRLIQEAADDHLIDEDLGKHLQHQIDQHSKALENISRQRNNLIAHRSPSFTFKEVTGKFPITTDDLAALSTTYYEVARQMHLKVPFHNAWQLGDFRTGTRSLLRALRK